MFEKCVEFYLLYHGFGEVDKEENWGLKERILYWVADSSFQLK